MKKGKGILLIVVLCLSISACSSDNGLVEEKGEEKQDEEVYEWEIQEIGDGIEKDVYDEDVILGSLNKYKKEINIPKNSFDEKTKVIIEEPNIEDVGIKSNKYKPMSSLYAIRFDGEQLRTNKPLEVSIKLDEEIFDKKDQYGGFRVINYTEDFGWIPFQVEVDGDNRLVKFETHHNSIWGVTELSKEEQIDEYTSNRAREQWALSQKKEDLDEMTEEIVEEMLIGAFNQSNRSMVREIAEETIDNAIFGKDNADILRNIRDGDTRSLTANVAGKAGGIINNKVQSGVIGAALDGTGAVAQSLGALSGGDPYAASEYLADYLLDNSRLVGAARTATQVINTRIDNWRNNEVEKAYQVYINGASSSVPWGFQAEPGDFDSIWDQMSGVAMNVRSNEIQNYADAKGIHVSEIPDNLAERLRERSKENLKRQFEQRKEQEETIRELEAHNDMIIERFEDHGLLNRRAEFFPRDMPINVMIDRLFGQIERVLRDTNRSEVIYDEGFVGDIGDNKARLTDILSAIRTNYTEGREAYYERLIELGLLEEPGLEGKWKGSIVFNDYYLPAQNIPIVDEDAGFEESMEEALAELFVGLFEKIYSTIADGSLDIPLEIEFDDKEDASHFRGDIKIDLQPLANYLNSEISVEDDWDLAEIVYDTFPSESTTHVNTSNGDINFSIKSGEATFRFRSEIINTDEILGSVIASGEEDGKEIEVLFGTWEVKKSDI